MANSSADSAGVLGWRIQAPDLEFRRSFVLPVEEKFRTMITVVAGDISSHCWPGASFGGSTLAMMSIGRSWSGSLSVMFPCAPGVAEFVP